MIKIKNKYDAKDAEKMFFSNLTVKDIGKSAMFYCIVEEVFQTGGPTIFKVNDGTMTFSAKSFIAKGARSLPHIKEGDFVQLVLKISWYDDNLE